MPGNTLDYFTRILLAKKRLIRLTPDGPGHAPDVLEPVADVLVGRQAGETDQTALNLKKTVKEV